MDKPQLIWNRMLGPEIHYTEFPCPPRRVTSMTDSYPPFIFVKLFFTGMLVMPLPKSSNVLSAGRDLHQQSAKKLIPSGVKRIRFWWSVFVPRGAGTGRKVTRHPFSILPRRQFKGVRDTTLPMQSCFLPGTGRSSGFKGFDPPQRDFSLVALDGAS